MQPRKHEDTKNMKQKAFRVFVATQLFANTKPRKNMRQHVLARAVAGHVFERRACFLEIGKNEFLRQRLTISAGSRAGPNKGIACLLHEADVAEVGDRRPIREQIDVE